MSISIELVCRQSIYSVEKFLYAPVTYFRRIFLRKDNAKYKKYFLHRWGFWHYDLENANDEVILIYASSAGEFLNTGTFCQLLKNKYPNCKIALCTAGYDIDFDLDKHKSRIPWFDYIFIAPWDTSLAISNILTTIKIKLFICFIILIDNPLMLIKFRKSGLPTLLVNGLMSKGMENLESNRCPTLNSKRNSLLQYYKYYDLLGVQNEIDKDNFTKRGVCSDKIFVTGNMKADFNDIVVSEEEKRFLKNQLGLVDEQIILVAGSIHLNEEKLLAETFFSIRKVLPDFRLVIVPRFMAELESIEKALDGYSLTHLRKTEMFSLQKKPKHFDAIVVDTFGELKRLYSVGDYIYMGGSSQKKHPDAFGSHNILEPLVYKKPIFFGPYLYLFKEITDCLEKAWPGLRIKNSDELANGIIYLHSHTGVVKAIYDASFEIIKENIHSFNHNVELASRLLN